ncbi:MAG: Txe/YoeB family addiction module toxin [Bacteroidales bacterium]|jgi:toxin YoeB|nr:Txe/YoeB family addiction module toxin [Bacteroidales bacterium]MBR4678194.1 Txe/YoeB family addiction module toxin [Bacteroidales bacterium]
MYAIQYTKKAEDGLKKLRQSEPSAFKKALKLLEELIDHPKTGTGKPKQLSGDCAGQWSRRITDKHRLVYTVNDNEITVLVLTTYGHYDDK